VEQNLEPDLCHGRDLNTGLSLTSKAVHRGMVVFGAFGVEGRWFDSTSSRDGGTLGKSFTRSCLYDVMWLPVWLPCVQIRLL